jgi:adenylyltransferase/sulfurtransferase
MSFDEVRLRKNPDCPVCGDKPTVTELIDYEQFCGMPAHDNSLYTAGMDEKVLSGVPQITPKELEARLAAGESLFMLDVREPHEWQISNLGHYGAILIPQGQVMERMGELDTAQEIIVQCRTGVRSAQIVALLQEHGFSKLHNLDGGINRWARDVEPEIPVY